MSDRAFHKIMAGLEAAIAYAQGDTSKAIVHTQESIRRRRKELHRERANLRVVGTPPVAVKITGARFSE